MELMSAVISSKLSDLETNKHPLSRHDLFIACGEWTSYLVTPWNAMAVWDIGLGLGLTILPSS